MADLTASRLKEQALLLGPRRALVGILTPPAERAPARDTTVVILNSGVIHRVGANRLHVELARQLAGAGFRTLRFDLSGIGDSPPRADGGLSLLETAMRDIREAVDHVAGKDGRVALFGLCSGAAHALLYAPDDERVAGLMLLDLWIPQTRRYRLLRTWKRVTGKRGWVNLLTGRHWILQRATKSFRGRIAATESSADGAAADARADDPLTDANAVEQGRALLAAAFRPVLARKVPILAVFTAGLEDQHNYAKQLYDAFPDIDFGDRVRLEWFPESDHTFSSSGHRRRLRDLVVGWMSAAPAATAAPQRSGGTAIATALWLALSSTASSLLSSTFFSRR